MTMPHLRFHAKDQWDLNESGLAETVIACHVRTDGGNRSTRLFAHLQGLLR